MSFWRPRVFWSSDAIPIRIRMYLFISQRLSAARETVTISSNGLQEKWVVNEIKLFVSPFLDTWSWQKQAGPNKEREGKGVRSEQSAVTLKDGHHVVSWLITASANHAAWNHCFERAERLDIYRGIIFSYSECSAASPGSLWLVGKMSSIMGKLPSLIS